MERPVEELMGWTKCGRCGTWRRPDWDYDCGATRAEVDDIASWLDSTGADMVISVDNFYDSDDGWWVAMHDRSADSLHGTGPTIRDALIDLVRKVAEQ